MFYDLCYYYFCQPGSTVSQFTLNICLHVHLYTFYNVFMNLEIAYSDLMNLRLHNNIHVFILSLKVNNASATFIIMIQVAHAKPTHSFHDSNFHNIFSSIYKVLNHKNNDYYIISKLSEIHVLVMNMTTTINILPIPIIMLQQLFLIFHIHFCPLKPVCYRYFTTILSSALDIIIYPLSRHLFTGMLKIDSISVHKPVTTNINMIIRRYASKLNENVCSNLSMARYVYMLYVFMDEIIKSQYYIILYNMLHIHLRCEMSAHIISSIFT